MRVPLLIAEEYSARNRVLDWVVRVFLFPFRNTLFLSQTRRSKHFLENSRVRSFLIPPAEPKRIGKKGRKNVLFVSKLLATKNPLIFLKLAAAFPEEKFILIGKGEMEKEIAEKAKSLPNLKIIDKVESREELFKYYSEAKLFIHPAWKDPIGHVIIEALSTQTPVLASSGAGASDFLPKEWVASPKDEQEWIQKTKYILEHQEESIKKAEEIFEKEHLNIDDPYFEKVAEELVETLKKKWPKLFVKD
jgi:glycosyltransferase involved in cell wall biosynthesis